MKTNKKGISLIVLVITIIVMLVLAGAIIVTLTNNGIIGRAKDARDKTNLNEVKEAANLLWSEAFLNNIRDQEGLEDAVINGLIAQKVDTTKYTITVTTNGVTVELKEAEGEEEDPVGPTVDNLYGVWVFNDEITEPTFTVSDDLGIDNFICDTLSPGFRMGINGTKFIYLAQGPMGAITTEVYNFTTDTWINEKYKTVNFAFGTEGKSVSEDFFEWLIANATYQNTREANEYTFTVVNGLGDDWTYEGAPATIKEGELVVVTFTYVTSDFQPEIPTIIEVTNAQFALYNNIVYIWNPTGNVVLEAPTPNGPVII